MQQARRRIARNRRALQRDALRASHQVRDAIDWRLQSQERPGAMLLGAVGVGMVASRLMSSIPSRQGWEKWLFDLATSNMTGRFWRQLAESLVGRFSNPNVETTNDTEGTE